MVGIPNTDGKAGMAALKLDEKVEFDIDQFSRFVDDNLPFYSRPVFLRIIEELEFTGTHKLRKVNFRKEGYNIEIIKEPIFYWDNSAKKYKAFGKIEYQNLRENKLRI